MRKVKYKATSTTQLKRLVKSAVKLSRAVKQIKRAQAHNIKRAPKAIAPATPKPRPIIGGFGTRKETKEEVFARLRSSDITQFLDRAQDFYSLTDEERDEIYLTISTWDDNFLKRFINLYGFGKIYYESNDELSTEDAFSMFDKASFINLFK